MVKNNIYLFLIFFALLFVPVSLPQKNLLVFDNRALGGASIDFFKPESIFDTLKKNLRVPEFNKNNKIELPGGDTLKKDITGGDVRKFSEDVGKETGINPLKFIKWMFNLLSRILASLAEIL